MNRPLRITIIVLGTFLGVWFLLAGSQKFLSAPMFEAMFERLGLPLALVPVVGVAEIAAALLVLWPRTSLYGSSVIVVVMLGAVGSHLASGEAFPVPALVALAMAGSVMFLRLRERGGSRD